MADVTLEALLRRGARSRRPTAFRRTRSSPTRPCYDDAERDWQGVLGRAGARAPRLVRGVGHDPRVGPAVREVVRRRQAERRVQLPRPPRRRRPRRPGRVPLGGRAGRHPRRSPTPSCSTSRAAPPTRCKALGVEKGDRVAIYIGHGARAAGRDARVRRGSAPRTRSCSAASPPTRCATASTTPRPRCSSPATARGGAAASCRSRRSPTRRSPRRRRSRRARAAAHRATTSRCRTAATSGGTTLVAGAVRRVPARADGRRGPALHPLHVGTTGKPKGIMHTTGGYLTQVAYTHKYVFDLHPDTDVYWCTADSAG